MRPAVARLLDDHGHWRALVQQPQLAVGVAAVAWVAVDAAVQQRAVEVAHQRPDVPAPRKRKTCTRLQGGCITAARLSRARVASMRVSVLFTFVLEDV